MQQASVRKQPGSPVTTPAIWKALRSRDEKAPTSLTKPQLNRPDQSGCSGRVITQNGWAASRRYKRLYEANQPCCGYRRRALCSVKMARDIGRYQAPGDHAAVARKEAYIAQFLHVGLKILVGIVVAYRVRRGSLRVSRSSNRSKSPEKSYESSSCPHWRSGVGPTESPSLPLAHGRAARHAIRAPVRKILAPRVSSIARRNHACRQSSPSPAWWKSARYGRYARL